MPTLNPLEAPEGYVAVLKSIAKPDDGSNICRACDWRPTCQQPDTDFTNHNHRCMDYTVIHRLTGQRIRRDDGCSVVFKRVCDHEDL
jgi:hypothetical protein